MVTYVCLGILFLFVLLRGVHYYNQRKKAPTPEQLDQLALAIFKNSDRGNS